MARIKNDFLVPGFPMTKARGGGDCAIFMERFDCNLLEHIRETSHSFRRSNFKRVAHSLLSGLDGLHGEEISHNDIKPQNILTYKDGSKTAICDFGLSSRMGKPTYSAYTSYYRPIELFGSWTHYPTSYSHATDIWALGCTLVEYLTGNPLFIIDDHEPDFSRFSYILGDISKGGRKTVNGVEGSLFQSTDPCFEGISDYLRLQKACPDTEEGEKMIDLLSSMLSVEPRLRPTAAQLLKHPLFEQRSSSMKRSPKCADISTIAFQDDPFDYIGFSKDVWITERNREKSVEWMDEFCVIEKFDDETFFLAVHLFDRYLSLARLSNLSQMQTLVCACLSIAAKHVEKDLCDLSLFTSPTAGKVGTSALIGMEISLLEVCGFKTSVPTVYTILLNDTGLPMSVYGISTRFSKLVRHLKTECRNVSFLRLSYRDTVVASIMSSC